MKMIIALLMLSFVAALRAEPERIDLPTVLRLAGAQNLDVQLAAEKLNEARAVEQGTLWQFFPWVSPGVGYRAHDGRLQDVAGNVYDVHKQSLTVGPTIQMQLDLGDAIYKRLVAKQLTKAAQHGVDSQRRQSVLAAAEAYFDLAKAHADARVADESVQISKDYENQITNGVKAGVAFKGDALRAETQRHRNELLLKQAGEARRTAAARLAQVLRLDPAVDLLPRNDDAVAMKLTATSLKLDALINEALAKRPEIKQSAALNEAARQNVKGAKYGPLVPTLGAQVFAGGFGGGQSSASRNFGGSEDYQITLGWRLGAGGLFDTSRIRAAESKAAQSAIRQASTHDEVVRQVVENHERVKLLRSQLDIARQSVKAAQEALKLAQERKELSVGVVLETLQSEQDATRAKLDYVNTVMELNKAQYRLKAAVGE